MTAIPSIQISPYLYRCGNPLRHTPYVRQLVVPRCVAEVALEEIAAAVAHLIAAVVVGAEFERGGVGIYYYLKVYIYTGAAADRLPSALVFLLYIGGGNVSMVTELACVMYSE